MFSPFERSEERSEKAFLLFYFLLHHLLRTKDNKRLLPLTVYRSASSLLLSKQVWVNAGDVVLVGLRDYQDGKADVILKYSAEEARALKSYGELPESLRINEATEALGGKGRGEERRGVFGFFLSSLSRPRHFCVLTFDIPLSLPHSSSSNHLTTEEETGAGDDFFDFQDVADI